MPGENRNNSKETGKVARLVHMYTRTSSHPQALHVGTIHVCVLVMLLQHITLHFDNVVIHQHTYLEETLYGVSTSTVYSLIEAWAFIFFTAGQRRGPGVYWRPAFNHFHY